MQTFNANEYTPNQGTPKHPEGKFAAGISGTEVGPALKEGTDKGMCLTVTFSTNVGQIQKRYNVDFPGNAETSRISREQLSALCHAVGKFQLNFQNQAVELRNGQCVIEVGKQIKNPEYNEVRTIYDIRGELPKANAAPQSQHQPPAPPPPPAYAPQPMAAPSYGVMPQQPMGQTAAYAPQPNQPPQGGFAPQPMTAPPMQPYHPSAPQPVPGQWGGAPQHPQSAPMPSAGQYEAAPGAPPQQPAWAQQPR